MGQLRGLSLFARVHVESFHRSHRLHSPGVVWGGGGDEIFEKTSQEALLQSVDFNNLGMITSLPNLTYVDMQTLSQVTTRARGTQQHCLMRV